MLTPFFVSFDFFCALTCLFLIFRVSLTSRLPRKRKRNKRLRSRSGSGEKREDGVLGALRLFNSDHGPTNQPSNQATDLATYLPYLPSQPTYLPYLPSNPSKPEGAAHIPKVCGSDALSRRRRTRELAIDHIGL